MRMHSCRSPTIFHDLPEYAAAIDLPSQNCNWICSTVASNTTFTLSRTTYTVVPNKSYGQKQALDITTNHNFTSCSFTNCSSTQTHGGAIRCASGAYLAVHSCTFVDNDVTQGATGPNEAGAIYFEAQSTEGYGGGLLISEIPSGSVVKNVRFEECRTELTGGSIDNSLMKGSMLYSNILISGSSTKHGNCVFSSVAGTPQISFFSCMFDSNTVDEQLNGQFAGVDVRFSINNYWKTCLTDPSLFVNSYSTSIGHRILYEEPELGPRYATFEFLSSTNKTNMNILLPNPRIIVSIGSGVDKNGCGTSNDNKCKTLKFVGECMIPLTDGNIVVEAGRYDESTTMDIGSKNTTFSSSGASHPIVVYSGQTPFITKTDGELSLDSFVFVPKSGRMVFLQTGAGSTTFSDCSIQLNGEASTAISEPLFKTTAGALTIRRLKFTDLVFSGGCCVSCLGTSTTLSVQSSSFVGLTGQSEPCLNFKRDSKGGTLTLSQIEIEGTAGSLIGGITTSNVQKVSISVTNFSRLMSTSQEAALSITSCSTLTLSGLLFENCTGQSASSLFVDHTSTSVFLPSPIPSSFSVCSSPRACIRANIAPDFLPHPASININPKDGTDGQFCWSSAVGCQSLSGLVDRLMATSEYTLNVADGTTSESTLSITSKKTIAVTGLGSARSLIVMKSIAQSFADLSAGSLSLASLGFTETSSQIGVARPKSLFEVKGGSLRLESVQFVPLSFTATSSLVKMSGSSTLSLKSVLFVSMKNAASGAVISSTSTGQISLDTVSFASCNCGSSGKGRSVFISRSSSHDKPKSTHASQPCSSFSAGKVVMKSVSISTAGTTGSHEVYLEGQNVGAVVTSDWVSLIGANDATLTKTKLEQVVGSDSINMTNCGPLGYHLYPHTSGAVFVSERFWDHGKCGQERLPCSSFSFAFLLLTNTKTTISLSSDITLSTLLECPETGASISSSSQKSLVFESTGLFVVEDGPLTLMSVGLTIPSSLTQPLFVVKGSSLTLSDSVTITSPASLKHTTSLFIIQEGTLTLSESLFDFADRFLSSSVLLAQTAGCLALDTVTIENVHRSDGDGSFVYSSLTSSDDRLEIVSCSFSACSSTGNGGCMAIAVEAGTLLISHSSFSRCSSADRGGALLLDFSNLLSFEHYKLDTVCFGREEERNTATNFGNDVFVIGRDLASQIEASQWEDSLTAAQQSDLMGSDSLTQNVESLLRFLVGDVVFVSSSGDDLNIGLKDSPFRTLAGLFYFVLKVKKVVVLDSASIGELMWLGVGEEEGREMLIVGQDDNCSLRCDIVPFDHKHGTPFPTFSMLTLHTHTLSGRSVGYTQI
ncbi:hypothetical protein BLNAU_19884 [Blattamonas nauphoetae]|uniref:Uncharacterized protein n=1 Tax=Blattamonas nauphoetae TaxID=2049346 RepID=A0ABQ9X0G5_9EUKA|nr:hypothetical protein BLNAU_19884 [Blattamonas nauphoetae]